MKTQDPRGYPDSGRYDRIADSMGRSEPRAWQNDRIRAGRFPIYNNDRRTRLQLAKEAQRYLALERGIVSGDIQVKTINCRECGSGRYPHVCW